MYDILRAMWATAKVLQILNPDFRSWLAEVYKAYTIQFSQPHPEACSLFS